MKPEVAELIDKAKESLEVARLIFDRGFLDFSASRAYYALFYIAQALLLDRGLSFSSHGAVISAYGREFAKTKLLDPKYHKYLIQAQHIRNIGDYGPPHGVTESQASQLLQWAEEFLTAARGYLAR